MRANTTPPTGTEPTRTVRERRLLACAGILPYSERELLELAREPEPAPPPPPPATLTPTETRVVALFHSVLPIADAELLALALVLKADKPEDEAAWLRRTGCHELAMLRTLGAENVHAIDQDDLDRLRRIGVPFPHNKSWR